MDIVIEWIVNNRQWLFSGVLVALPISLISWLISRSKARQIQKGGRESINIQVGNDLNHHGDSKSKEDRDD